MRNLIPIYCVFASLSGVAFAEVVFQKRIPRYPSNIVLDASVADSNCKLILDTGAEISLLDESLKALVGPFQKNASLGYQGGIMSAPLYVAPKILLGSVQLRNSSVGLTNLLSTKVMTGADTAGIVGLDAIKDLCLDINYDNGLLRLTRDLPNEKERWKFQQIKKDSRDFVTRASVESELNSIPIDFRVDLGSNLTIQLSDKNFTQLKDAGWITEGEEMKGLSVGGKFSVRSGKFTQGMLLDVDLTGLSVTGSGDSNLMGRGFLILLNFKFDLQTNKFYYIRNSLKSVLNPHKQMGLVFVFSEGKALIAAIKQGSKAESAGFRKGDVVTKIDTLGIGELNEINIFKLCDERKGMAVPIELLRDNERVVLNLDILVGDGLQ